VLFVQHSAKKSLPCAALGKVLLSVTTAFTESRTLDTEIHSTKKFLPRAKHSANGSARQRAVSRRLKLTAVIFAESRVLALSKEASLSSAPSSDTQQSKLAECYPWTLDKVYFIFFILPTKLFVVCSYTM
jgi:IS4 transposase